MLALDIESLGVKTDSVVLSIGMCYIKDNTPVTYEAILNASIFVKLNAQDQIARLGRKIDRSTVDWWAKQSEPARNASFKPSPKDLSPEEGFVILKKWLSKYDLKNEQCWIRGSIDQLLMDALAEDIGVQPILQYNVYRDIRTAIDLLYPETGKNGYVEIDDTRCIGYAREKVLRHHPCHDVSEDMAMLLFGKQS